MIVRSVRARREERRQRLPGDELLVNVMGGSTHAITIRRRRRDVWPWLVQMGADRAGWYSYDVIDNGGQPSAEQIRPELQQVQVGDVFPAMPGVKEGFVVLQLETDRLLVLGWPSPDGTPMTTWAFVLKDTEEGHTRLIVRARAAEGYEPPFGLPRWTTRSLVPIGHFIMQRKQLLGIARRVERSPQPVREHHRIITPLRCENGACSEPQVCGCS